VKIGFVGFGNVGRALARLLLNRRTELERRHDLIFKVTLLTSASRGALIDPSGIDLTSALDVGWSARRGTLEAIAGAPLDLIFEATPLDPRGGEPALSHVRAALERGVSVVSANKGPVAFAARELFALARRTGAGFRFESAVADCLPLFNLVEGALPVGRVTAFRGVLNSTSNHVLQTIAGGGTEAEGVAEMRRLGLAEADPSHDLDGWDQAVKVAIVANVLLGRDLRPADVERVPLSAIDVGWLRAEQAAGRRVRLAASAGAAGPARVGPVSLEPGEFLASLHGVSLGITLETDLAGAINVSSVDPHVEQTAYGMLADMVAIHQGRRFIPSPLQTPRDRDL
jgi:homoserine dehydrogenase